MTPTERDDRLAALRAKLASSERIGGAGYVDRIAAIKAEIARLEGEQDDA